MVESVDTRDLKSLGVRAVWVQVPLRLPWENKNKINDKQCRETALEGGFFMSKSPFPNIIPNMINLIALRLPEQSSSCGRTALSA